MDRPAGERAAIGRRAWRTRRRSGDGEGAREDRADERRRIGDLPPSQESVRAPDGSGFRIGRPIGNCGLDVGESFCWRAGNRSRRARPARDVQAGRTARADADDLCEMSLGIPIRRPFAMPGG